jgi:DNA-binding transcriptional LysR family regulator
MTPAGEALIPYARSVLASLEDAHVAVAAVDREIRTRLEVIANESISTYLLPTALSDVRKSWPKLRIAVTVGICPSITEGLSTARYDVGLMLQTTKCTPAESGLTQDSASGQPGIVDLADVPLVLFGVSAHPMASRPRSAPILRSQLATETVFISDARGYFFNLVRDYFQSKGVPGAKLEATGSVEAVKRCVVTEQMALGVLPGYAIAEELRIGRFTALSVQPRLPRVRLQAMSYRTRLPAHPAVSTLLDAVQRSVGRQLPEQRQPVRSRRESFARLR